MDRHKRGVCFFMIFGFFAVHAFAEELVLNVNLKKPISVADEKFLSLTFDPATLLHRGNALSAGFEKSTSMARALAPAYVRLGGPSSNYPDRENEGHSQGDENESKIAFSESDWILTHQWAQKAGLDVISCMAPEYSRDSEEALGIVSFSDHMGYNTSWQLGYECQTRCKLSASDLGKRVVNLRKMLNDFPRYSSSVIIGPDVVNYRNKQQQGYLRNYLSAAGSALSAITWHPDFAGVTLDEEGIAMHYDNLAADKDDLYQNLGPLAAKKPLWIAESKPEECQTTFLGALVWTRRLGNAAKLKIEIVMRQPLDLTRPTPDYWVSVLHKNLIGREAFDAKIQSGNKSHVHFYCQCTRATEKYERGSLTVFGINLTPSKVVANLKGIKITSLHKYILLPGFDAPNRMFAETVFLNDKPLNLINDTYVPDIKPVIMNDPKGLRLHLPSGGIGFWVLPNLKIKSCMGNHEDKSEIVSSNRIHKRTAEENQRKAEEDNKKEIVQKSIPRRESLQRKKIQNLMNNNVRRFKQHNRRREMRRLRKYLKRRLRDAGRTTRNTRHEKHNKKESKETTLENLKNTDEHFESQEDLRTKLKEFKDHLSENDEGTKMAGEKFDDEIITEALSLISKIEKNLNTAKQEIDVDKKMKLSADVESDLNSLYDLVTKNYLSESKDTSESDEEETKRIKRDLNKKMTEAPMGVKRESVLKKRSRNDEMKESRKTKRKEEIRKEVQPSVLNKKISDSEENTFYGFFKTKPVAGFPEGDVFFRTDDSAQSDDYDYVRDEEEKLNKLNKENPRLTIQDQTEEENDSQGHAPNEYFETIKMPSARVIKNLKDHAELWEAENHEETNSDKSQEAEISRSVEANENEETSGNEGIFQTPPAYREERKFPMENYDLTKSASRGSGVRPSIRIRQTPRLLTSRIDKGRTADQRARAFDYGVNQFFKGTDFPMGDQEGIQQGRRLRRKSNNLNTVFEQEMINEDDNNLKDCRCRVIRRFREPSRLCDFHLERRARGTREIKENAENISGDSYEASVESITEDSPDLLAIDPNSYLQTEETKIETDLTVTEPEVPIVQNSKNDERKIQITTEHTWVQKISPDHTQGVDTNIEKIETHDPQETSPRNIKHSSQDTLKNIEENISPLSTLQNEDTFFRNHSANLKNENTTVHTIKNTTEHSTSASKNIPPTAKETSTKKSTAVPEEVSQTGSPTTTLEPSLLPEKKIAEKAEETQDNDRPATGSLKGPIKFVTDGPETVSADLEIQQLKDSRQNKILTSRAVGSLISRSRSRSKSKSERGSEKSKSERGSEKSESERGSEKSERGRGSEKSADGKIRSLLSSRMMSNNKRGRIMEIPRKSLLSYNRDWEQPNRKEQIERLKAKLREKREKMLREYQEEVRDIVEKIEDEEKRNLRRREAWERIKESEDFRKMIDREKLAYILMYKPGNYDLVEREERSSGKRYAPSTEVLRGLNVRERMVRPGNQRYFGDPMILRHSNPYSLKESVRFKDILGNLAPRKEGEKGEGKYYAIVENVKNPRIFQFRGKQVEEQERNVQPPPILLPNGYIFNRPQYRHYQEPQNNYKVSDNAEEEEEKSNESSADRKIYVIDPSTYKGGEPVLQLHEDSEEESKGSLTRIPENFYRMVWNPFLNGLHASGRTVPRAENSEKEIPVENVEENNDDENVHNLSTSGLQDLSKKYSKTELLRILMKSLGLQNMNQDFGGLTEQKNEGNVINNEETENQESGIINTETTELPEQISQQEQNVSEQQQPEEIEQPGSQQSVLIDDKDKLQNDEDSDIQINQGSIDPEDQPEIDLNETGGIDRRKRRDTDSLANFLLRKTPRDGKRVSRQNYFRFAENSDEADNDPSKVFKLINNNGNYMAVPIENLRIKNSLVSKNLQDYIRLVEQGQSDDIVINNQRGSLNSDEVFVPPRLSNKYSPGKLYEDLIESVKNQDQGFEDYREDLGSKVESLEKPEERSEEFSSEFAEENESDIDDGEKGGVENGEESGERVRLKDVMVFDEPEILMVVPWRNRKFDRLRRHVKAQGKMDGNQNADEVQSLQLQNLEESVVPDLLNSVDAIDELVLKKKPVPKFSEKQKLSKDYNKKIKTEGSGEDKNKRLPSFIEGAIPKLETVIIDGIEKAQNLTESVEQLIENFDEKFNETMKTTGALKNSLKPESCNTTQNVLRSAITNIKKFFVFLSGFTRILCG